MQPWSSVFRSIATIVWIGGLWVIGLLVAPILFDQVDKATAGRLAGVLFRAMAWVGMVAGVYLVIHSLWQQGLQSLSGLNLWLILIMLGLTLLNHFVIFPIIADIKAQVHSAVEGVFGGGFASWHTISAMIYLLQSVLGLVFVARDGIKQ